MTEKYHQLKLEEARLAEEKKNAEIINYNVENGNLIGNIGEPMRTKSTVAKGKYFSCNGMAFLATTMIPAGDIINPGTNCERVDITDLLNI